ncbi:cobalamin biosynthesis bifunctional protein CbiET, partial [Gemmiger formicilis]|uniref:SAM-dependent methyltransferase n=1 Tax=Gemmiger formicilis TaxID=745368 RepID=UPI001D99996C
MQVNLLALGGGTETTMTAQTQAALLQAQCIVGAARLIERLPAECTPNRAAATKPQKILEALRAANCDRAAVVYSGDTGFYSGCRNLVPLLEEQGIAYTVFPGISSV